MKDKNKEIKEVFATKMKNHFSITKSNINMHYKKYDEEMLYEHQIKKAGEEKEKTSQILPLMIKREIKIRN
ncbi:MAG: hypothetical protein ACTSSL_13535 [Candidatus Heimdallarchaeaceae archaeon]